MKHPKNNPSNIANPMWGGQFAHAADLRLGQLNASVGVDKRLYRQDIAGSIAHAKMLAKQEIISAADAKKIVSGLERIEKEIATGTFVFKESLEDIHMNIEAALKDKIGDCAGRLHTARSRNDQVATDFRLFTREACDAADAELQALQAALIARAQQHASTLMPGFTHLQNAQPVTLGHHLLAYVEMFGRDRSRFRDARARMNESPLGAAALAGSTFPIDRAYSAKSLGFARPMANSLDAVSSRDFALEFLSAAAICAVNLSRLAEEFVLWSSQAFGFIRFSDAWSTGSSIMPQKRNPDAAELVRGKAGRMLGNLMSLLATMKALPLAYNKDMQEDKEPLFDSADSLLLCLQAMAGMVSDFSADEKRMEAAAGEGYSDATDLADWLAREAKMPFREAHHAAAKIVKLASAKGKNLADLSLKEMQGVEARITPPIFSALGAKHSAAARKSFGGTAPGNVKKAAIAAKKRFL